MKKDANFTFEWCDFYNERIVIILIMFVCLAEFIKPEELHCYNFSSLRTVRCIQLLLYCHSDQLGC